MTDPNSYAFRDQDADLGLLETNVRPQEVDRLNPYLAIAAEIQAALNPADAAVMLGKLSQGLVACGTLLGATVFHANQAKAARQKAEAIAALDEFPKYLVRQREAGVEVKPTDKTRDYFVDQYPLVLEAREKENFYHALYEKLAINRNVLSMAISSARAIAFGYREHNSLSSAAVAEPSQER